MSPKITATTLLMALLTTSALPALADDCDIEAAKVRWQKAVDNGIVFGAGMIRDIPSFSVDERLWGGAGYNSRVGMVRTFECIVSGPDKMLTKVQVVNQGGETLAVWDNIAEEFDFK